MFSRREVGKNFFTALFFTEVTFFWKKGSNYFHRAIIGRLFEL